jgi:hypothetical protein
MARKKLPPPPPDTIPENVLILPTVASVQPPEIVVILQDLLERARSGEITGMVATTVCDDGGVVFVSAGMSDVYQAAGLVLHQLLNLLQDEGEG